MAESAAGRTAPPPVDVALLAGFEFACLPGCGLCCFTSPRLDPGDERRVRSLAPGAVTVLEEGERRLAARRDGGACQFLSALRCRIHAARPGPCREFPVFVHIGNRLQATLVLSCPGLGLSPLASFGSDDFSRPASGLDEELVSVRQRLGPATERRRAESERRRRKIVRVLEDQGRWVDEQVVRRRLRNRRLFPGREEFVAEEPPAAEDGLEYLPLYFDGRPGPVALARGLGGWEALEIAPEGGAHAIGVAVPPDEPPAVDRAAEGLLEGYLHYWLARDCFLAAVHLEMLSTEEENVVDTALHQLHMIGSSVLSRAVVRAKLRGDEGRLLGQPDIEHGIRATDQDWLDRPTWGSRL